MSLPSRRLTAPPWRGTAEARIQSMAARAAITADAHVKKVPAGRRQTVEAVRRLVKAAAPKADEISYPPGPPKSKTYMWKIVRYAVDGANVVGIGTFENHSTLFFYRGRELDDGSGLLKGGGKEMRSITLTSPDDAARPEVRRMVRKAFRLGGAA
jgi:hypothetical protein